MRTMNENIYYFTSDISNIYDENNVLEQKDFWNSLALAKRKAEQYLKDEESATMVCVYSGVINPYTNKLNLDKSKALKTYFRKNKRRGHS